MLVRCRTWWQYIKVLRWHKIMGHTWKSGMNPINRHSIWFWLKFRDSTTVSLNNGFCFNSNTFFEGNGLHVYEFITMK